MRKFDYFYFLGLAIPAICIIGAAIAGLGMLNDKLKGPSPEQVGTKSAIELLRAQRGELSDWQMLTLAIALTESRCNPEAVGQDGDVGCCN